MLFEWIKILHIISASVLFGTGIGTAFYMFYVNFSNDTKLIARATKQVVKADWIFTGISGFIQPVTGFLLLYLKKFPFTATWTIIVTNGYLFAGICWFIVVHLQIKCYKIAEEASIKKTPLPKSYRRYFATWIALGIPAFTALMIVLFFMANSPFR
ncbi:MAG: DUF2269 domain-containing protein [Coxiellaceae bacterium]|nr:DUF2269 domain-containing protein [Coxiellaceae bacterium]